MLQARDVLTPERLSMLQTIADTGSMAAAARQLGLVPSALTYRVRQIEDALDVLIFDRTGRHARATEAGAELLREGARVLQDIDAIAQRVRRVATGWEAQLTIVSDDVIARPTLLDLVHDFLALEAPTRLQLRTGVLNGTLETLTSGQADLALGVAVEASHAVGLHTHALGELPFVFVVAPHHPLATALEPLPDTSLIAHRAIAVADSATHGQASVGLLTGQNVLTVESMDAKRDALLRGLGHGFLPEPYARSWIAQGLLCERSVERMRRPERLLYAWGGQSIHNAGRALSWWLEKLASENTQHALLYGHTSLMR